MFFICYRIISNIITYITFYLTFIIRSCFTLTSLMKFGNNVFFPCRFIISIKITFLTFIYLSIINTFFLNIITYIVNNFFWITKLLYNKSDVDEISAARRRDLYILLNLKDDHSKLNFIWTEEEIEEWKLKLKIS